MTASETRRSIGGFLPDKALGGLVLLSIGLVMIASYAIPGVSQLSLLAVAAICLVAFAVTREYGLAVAAGIVGGMGVGVIATSMTSDASDGVAFLVAFAAGFASVWFLGLLARPRETNPWPFIPAAIFVAAAVTVATGTTILFEVLGVLAVIGLIVGGTKALVDARKEV